MSVVRVGRRGAIVIPSEIRNRTGIEEGDELLVDVEENGIIYMMRRPKDFVAALRDSSGVWRELDPLEYVREERKSWDK